MESRWILLESHSGCLACIFAVTFGLVSIRSDQVRRSSPDTKNMQESKLARHGTVCNTGTEAGRHIQFTVRTCQRNPTQPVGDGRRPNKDASTSKNRKKRELSTRPWFHPSHCSQSELQTKPTPHSFRYCSLWVAQCSDVNPRLSGGVVGSFVNHSPYPCHGQKLQSIEASRLRVENVHYQNFHLSMPAVLTHQRP